MIDGRKITIIRVCNNSIKNINYCIIIIIIIIKTESAAQGRERVRALYQSEDPTPHNQPMEGRKKRKQ